MNVLSKVPAFSSVSCSQSSSLSNASPQSVKDHDQPRCGIPSKLVEVVKEFLEANRVVQKQPSQQRFEACGLAVGRGITSPGSSTGPIATPAHKLQLLGLQKWFKLLEELRLGIRTNLGNYSPVEIVGTAWVPTMLQTLVQLPDGITQPGQLQSTKISSIRSGTLSRNPVGQAAS